MFEPAKLQINQTLFVEVEKQLVAHNEVSYKKLTLIVPEVDFQIVNHDRQKHSGSADVEIMTFFGKYVSQSIAIDKLEMIVQSMSYTNEELAIHIDRSHDAILKIFSSLVETKIRLTDLLEQIKLNLKSEEKSFVEYMKSLFASSEVDDIASSIKVIFKCMLSKGLQKSLRVDDCSRVFIEIGYGLIEAMYDAKALTADHRELIKTLNDELKQHVLQVTSPVSSNQTFTKLQTFGIVPDEGENVSLNTVMEKLLGVKDTDFESVDKSIESLDKLLKLYEKQTGVATGMIIFVSSNEDNYFDLSSLLNDTKIYGSEGVTEKMINTFDLLKTNKNPRVRKNDVIKINIDESKTKRAYLLWTNDMKTFKYKLNPIHAIDKLLRETPAEAIDAYNRLLTKIIEGSRTADAIAFNRVKYMSFNETMTEETFLNKLETELVSLVMSVAKKNKKTNMFDMVMIEEITKLVLDKIYKMKDQIGVQSFSSHTMIIYISMANKIVRNLKKHLINQIADKEFVEQTLSTIVKSNDNIYSRTIASYYLHLA